jgi:beta-N-acetylhexosaminidase
MSDPTSRVVRRRRIAALGVLGAIALLAGLLAGAGSGRSGPEARRTRGGPAGARHTPTGDAAAGVSLERQVGELLVVSFSGTRAPGYLTRALREGRVAGTILFGGNAPSMASVHALTASLQRVAGGDAIVCLDQEGGAIRTLAFAPPPVAQSGQPTPAAARAAAPQSARALRAAGVNVVLGPVADVIAGTPGSALASRAYPGGGDAVAASVRAAVGAYERAGGAPALKHFPGLGGATANTDAKPVAIGRSRAALLAELAPFRAAAGAAGLVSRAPAPLIMVGHARYPALDPHRIASQSHAIATDLLRGTLGFEGVAISDSLEARAAIAAAGGDVGRRCALRRGRDRPAAADRSRLAATRPRGAARRGAPLAGVPRARRAGRRPRARAASRAAWAVAFRACPRSSTPSSTTTSPTWPSAAHRTARAISR